MNIAQSLLVLLGETHTSRSKLAREIGVHTTTVTNWLDGRKIDSKNLLAVANYFGVSVDYLTGNETKKEPTTNHDDELLEYLEMLRTRPECRMLMSTVKGATREQVEANVKFLESLRNND